MKKLFWTFLIGITFLSGCTYGSDDQSICFDKTLNITKSMSENKKQEISDKYTKEFYKFYHNMSEDDITVFKPSDKIPGGKTSYEYNVSNDKTGYNRFMAVDKAIALTGVYREYTSKTTLDFINDNEDFISDILGDSLVMFGYTRSGHRIVCLGSGVTNNNHRFYAGYNKIRGLPEYELFEDMYFNGSYYLFDVYVENIGDGDVKDLKVEFFSSNGSEDPILREVEYDIDEKSQNILKKHNREIVSENQKLKIGEWSLFAIKKEVDIVRVSTDDEIIMLSPVVKLQLAEF